MFFSNSLLTGVRVSFGLKADILNLDETVGDDPLSARREVSRMTKQVLIPETPARVEALDEAGWKRLAQHLNSCWNEADRLMDRFGARLTPRQIELLLDIQHALRGASAFWELFPDLAGVPPERLPKGERDSRRLQSEGCDSASRELQSAMRFVLELTAGLA